MGCAAVARRPAARAGCGSLTSADADLLVNAFARHAPDAADRDALLIAAKNGCARALRTRLTNGRRLFAMVQADAPPSPSWRGP